MKKLKLNLDEIKVESFEVVKNSSAYRGTVFALLHGTMVLTSCPECAGSAACGTLPDEGALLCTGTARPGTGYTFCGQGGICDTSICSPTLGQTCPATCIASCSPTNCLECATEPPNYICTA